MSSRSIDIEFAQISEPNMDRVRTLGSVRLTREGTNERILYPKPSNDPNDPLNWSKAYKIYLMSLTSTALVLSNFMAAGPSIAIVELTINIFHAYPPSPLIPGSFAPASIARFSSSISKAAYLFSATALLQGISNLFWVPVALKYGRRKVYVLSFLLFGVTTIWASRANSFGNLLAARLVMGWFAGTAECVAPLTVADLFFLHERGTYMAIFAAALAAGAPLGSIVGDLFTLSTDWRALYYLGIGLIFAFTILAFFTMPETAFIRIPEVHELALVRQTSKDIEKPLGALQVERLSPERSVEISNIPKKTFRQNLAFVTPPQTKESFWKIFIRPILLLALPPVIWSTVTVGLVVGIVVILSVSLANDFYTIYHFETWQSGLCWIAVIIGTAIGMPICGKLADTTADFFTARAGGIREPEHRLPFCILPAFSMPGGLLMYGLSLDHHTHWAVPVVGLAIISVGIVGGTTGAMAYIVDAYRPIAGECVVSVMAFKAAFAFLIAFYTNSWLAADGPAVVYGTLAGIVFAWLALALPLYIWGKQLRQKSLDWKFIRLVQWDLDRETGE
ncbi:MFS general substrate transporter [Aureobasidium pullulans]|uniref:MFS general substrate transporter n=1 Tax=Aureobasidium pullulans TaxID=5580 RepID=A0A4S9WZV7_AURPU|nr:MFS general substrate transporter [Aureobasidium pullulans]THZ34542.1 MFS general substrate transporter [Aureobasidium pullulans]THZ64464.1 MFS general substrate transporter [Aureobasidium pullulans]THZ71848.1 MFS general substrate transporter [Aureobasidium pullulans]